MPDTKKIKKGRGPTTNRIDRTHLRRAATDADMKVSVVKQKEISKQKSIKKTQRKNSNKHRVRTNSAPARIDQPARIGQPVNMIKTDFLREGKMKLDRLFHGRTNKGNLSYEEYDVLRTEIGKEYAKIQLQQQNEIMRLSTDLRIVEKAKDKYLKIIDNLQDKLQPDQGTTGIQDILSGFHELRHNE